MKILIINPNTTASMTAKINQAALEVAEEKTEIITVNPKDGPASIEGYYDEAFSVPGLLREMRLKESENIDGYIIACFDDVGLDAARNIAEGPVVGICEAAVYTASIVAGSFVVVTTLPSSIPAIEKTIRGYGRENFCKGVRAANIPVLGLEEGEIGEKMIREEILCALKEDSPESIVLGCAGMADLAKRLSKEFEIPVIDGVASAVKIVEGIIVQGLKTSKAGGYAIPPRKIYKGKFSDDQLI